MVKLVYIVTVAMKTNEASLGTFSIDKFSVQCFLVMLVCTDTESERVVDVVIEQDLNVLSEVCVVSDLDNYVIVYACLRKVMPDHYSVHLVPGSKIDCYILVEEAEFQEASVGTFYIAVNEFFETVSLIPAFRNPSAAFGRACRS